MSDDLITRAKAALDGVTGESVTLQDTERYASWLRDGGPSELVAEVVRLHQQLSAHCEHCMREDFNETIRDHRDELLVRVDELTAERDLLRSERDIARGAVAGF